MLDNLPKSVLLVLKSEGGYTNHPKDPGGATNYGVLQRVYDSWRRMRNLVPRSVKLIEMDEVRAIYKENYWDLIRGDKLPLGVDYCVFDCCINSGPHQAILWLQRAVNKIKGPGTNRGLTVDGAIGAMTIDYVDDVDPLALVNEILDQRIGFMKIIRNKTTHELLWKYFGKGWDARLFGEIVDGKRLENGVDDNARAMIQLSPAKPSTLGPAPAAKPPINDAPTPITPKDIESNGGKWLLALLGVLAAIAAKLLS